uniref:Uncharacterized protein n=1 Tax=Guillardia theta TaxID=55529 RepID=A0A7S4L0K1_GUITH|mmetsp:Transcript_35084/g.109640  ORF Transcript_35084/g.109640 Transcript_35084/m.109640 type:complete len:725 (+) Transcript_35084:267-2441(+)
MSEFGWGKWTRGEEAAEVASEGTAVSRTGTWNFITKTVPSIPGFMSTMATRWLHDQEERVKKEKEQAIQAEIQDQIEKISALLRDHDRPHLRDGSRDFDTEIKYQLNRIQQLLHETKEFQEGRRGAGAQDLHRKVQTLEKRASGLSLRDSPARRSDASDSAKSSRTRSDRRASRFSETDAEEATSTGDDVGVKLRHEDDRDDLKTLFSRARHGRYKEVEALLDSGLSPDLRDEFGNTVLIIAAQNGNKRITKICLRRGANINAQNFRGQTSLHYCYAFGYMELGSYLESKGANPKIRNEFGLDCYEGIEPAEERLDTGGAEEGGDSSSSPLRSSSPPNSSPFLSSPPLRSSEASWRDAAAAHRMRRHRQHKSSRRAQEPEEEEDTLSQSSTSDITSDTSSVKDQEMARSLRLASRTKESRSVRHAANLTEAAQDEGIYEDADSRRAEEQAQQLERLAMTLRELQLHRQASSGRREEKEEEEAGEEEEEAEPVPEVKIAWGEERATADEEEREYSLKTPPARPPPVAPQAGKSDYQRTSTRLKKADETRAKERSRVQVCSGSSPASRDLQVIADHLQTSPLPSRCLIPTPPRGPPPPHVKPVVLPLNSPPPQDRRICEGEVRMAGEKAKDGEGEEREHDENRDKAVKGPEAAKKEIPEELGRVNLLRQFDEAMEGEEREEEEEEEKRVEQGYKEEKEEEEEEEESHTPEELASSRDTARREKIHL